MPLRHIIGGQLDSQSSLQSLSLPHAHSAVSTVRAAAAMSAAFRATVRPALKHERKC